MRKDIFRVSTDFKNRDDAERFRAQIENTQSVGPLAMLTGVSQQEAITELATSLASKKQNVDARTDRSHLASNAVNACIVYLENEIAHRDRRIADLERDLADLRAAQSLADPAGGHPYRSAPAPSRPVATSEAAPTRSSASGGWRRVYGALRGRGADACMALVPILAGVGVYLVCSAGGADTIGVVLGMGVTGLGSAPTLTWWRA